MSLKVTFCLRRLPSLTCEEFRDYWLNRHAALVFSLKDDLKIWKYVQSHPHPDALLSSNIQKSRGSPTGYDGIAEVWWERLEDLEVALSSAPGKNASKILYADERKFIDFANSPIWFAEEYEIITPEGGRNNKQTTL